MDIIINKYISSYALFINFHNHFIFHLVEAVSACIILWKCYDFPSQQFICDITNVFIESIKITCSCRRHSGTAYRDHCGNKWPAPGNFSVFLSLVFQNGGHIVFLMHYVFIILIVNPIFMWMLNKSIYLSIVNIVGPAPGWQAAFWKNRRGTSVMSAHPHLTV